MKRTAAISECGRYRWWLRREWSTGRECVCFVMLNPSTADHRVDDPTIRRCMGFAQAWGYRQLEVRNLFAWRATDPRELRKVMNPDGGVEGLLHLHRAIHADRIVLAWGANIHAERYKVAKILLSKRKLHCLGITKDGQPRHPLYVSGDVNVMEYRWCR